MALTKLELELKKRFAMRKPKNWNISALLAEVAKLEQGEPTQEGEYLMDTKPKPEGEIPFFFRVKVCRESGGLVVRFRGFTKDAIPETVRSLVDEGRIFYKMPDPVAK